MLPDTSYDHRRNLVSLSGLLQSAIRGWKLAVVLAAVGAAVFGARGWLATPIYRAEAVIRVADNATGGLAGVLGGELGTLASIAGVDVGGSRDRREEFLAMLESKSLLREFIANEKLLPLLFPDVWDSANKIWRDSRWRDSPPPMEDAIELFRHKILLVSQDRQTGLITVRVDWSDPAVAVRWLDDLIERVNQEARQSVITEARYSIAFLNAELTKNPTIELRESMNRLIEANLKRIVAAESEKQFALRVIDPAFEPDTRRPVRPKPILEAVLGSILGALAGSFVSAWRNRQLWWPDA